MGGGPSSYSLPHPSLSFLTSPSPLCSLAHAAADELDDLPPLGVTVDDSTPAAAGNGGEAAAGDAAAACPPAPSEAQRDAARAAVSSLRPHLETALQQLQERMRLK